MKRFVRRCGAVAIGAAVLAAGFGYLTGRIPLRPAPALFALAAAVAYVLAMVGPDLRPSNDPVRWFTTEQRAGARARAGGQCEYTAWGRRCERPSQEIDHFIPWSRGGATSLANAVCACRKHNQRKGGRMPSTFEAFGLFWRRRRYFTDQANRWPGEQFRRGRRREEQCR